jgi:hypothetical protein
MKTGSMAEAAFRANLDVGAKEMGKSRGALQLALEKKRKEGQLAVQQLNNEGNLASVNAQGQNNMALQQGRQAFEQPFETEKVNQARFKNNILAPIEQRQQEALAGTQETNRKSGEFNLGLATKFGEKKIGAELEAQRLGNENLKSQADYNKSEIAKEAEAKTALIATKNAEAANLQKNELLQQRNQLNIDANGNPAALGKEMSESLISRHLGRDTQYEPVPGEGGISAALRGVGRIGNAVGLDVITGSRAGRRYERAGQAREEARKKLKKFDSDNPQLATP